MSEELANNYCKEAKTLLETKTTLDKILSLVGYNRLKYKIKDAISLYTQAISQYYIIKNYHKIIDCYQEIAYLQAKPDTAIDTLTMAINVAIEHDMKNAQTLAETVIARHKYMVHPLKLLIFYEVCADYYWNHMCYKECIDCLYTLSTIHASQINPICEKIYENIIFLYLVKLNKPNLACVACDTLLMLYCKLPEKIEFYDKLRTLLKSEHKDCVEIQKYVSKLYYIPILNV